MYLFASMGVEVSGFYLWLNGKKVGYSEDSYLLPSSI